MLISLLFTSPILFIIIAIALIFSLSVHEFAHAYMADKLGDPTARLQGRVTLDPRAHLDPIGTLAIFLIGFGWGKPVMFDPYNLSNVKRDTALISSAGPISNLALAAFVALIYHFGLLAFFGQNLSLIFVTVLVSLNVMLAIFNLLPIYPLDGEKILRAFLPPTTADEYTRVMRQYGMWILLLLIVPINGSSAVSKLIGPLIDFITRWLIG